MARLTALETIRALQTLSEVLEYYDVQQKGLGARFLRYYDEQIERLKDMPKVGRIGRVFGTRELVMQDFPFLIVYRVRKEYLEILNIIHQSKKYPLTH
jgi:plasmid stabilization system protein ParE